MRKITMFVGFVMWAVSFCAALFLVRTGVLGEILATFLMLMFHFAVGHVLAAYERRRFELQLAQIQSFLRHSEGERIKILLGLPDCPVVDKEVE